MLERVPFLRENQWLAIGAGLLLVAASFAARAVADPLLPPGFPFVTFFPAVILAGFLFGARSGAVAAVACGLLAWWFYIAPANHYAITGSAIVAMLFYIFVVVIDLLIIAWMQAAHRALSAERRRSEMLATSRETMFHELQHRVSNNLQVVGAMLSLQRHGVSDPDALAALTEASRRVGVIGRVSRSLYDPDGASLGLEAMLTRLCHEVVDANGRDNVTIAVTGNGDTQVSSDAAVPIALIVAEAVANALEHGFADGRAGTIDVHVASHDDRIDITIADNGVGLSDTVDKAVSESLGLRIAHMLAGQLRGTFELVRQTRTEARLSFPVE